MTLESRTVVVIFLASMCLAALFFLDAPVRVDNSSTLTQDNHRQIRALRIPKPEYAGIIREQAVHVDMNNPGLRTEILYQGSSSLASTVVYDTRRATQDMRDHRKNGHEENHHRNMRGLHSSNANELKGNVRKRTMKENEMVMGRRKRVVAMKDAHSRKVNDLNRDIQKALDCSSDSGESSD